MRRHLLFCPLLALALVAGCDRKMPSAGTVTTGRIQQAEVPAPNAPLKDVIERDPRYLIGITYPEVANRHPRLAEALRVYANTARRDLDEAVGLSAGSGSAGMPYDLSLNFTELMNTPQVVVIAADGSLYTGGAHGIPLIARFTYLRQEDRLLSPRELIPSADGWKVISDYVRKQLREEVATRLVEDEVPEDERAEMLKNAASMIDAGTEPDAGNFAQFEPIPAADGRWFGLRFVFPPYQVGPYSDGTQTVEVPVAVLRPYLAPEYRVMFTGG
ncbi:DUF3298 domain-containing protein [Lysobacter pythonis]|uniref:DUF3298 domain-containing protein n=1 Tax=Solilutibacter pythonis TaxID=2483112 RepID=A0A3M2I4T3_9GAMM|nr:DUF3298 and DUF4163 domain-containing protein [Lysobacter pythonis]RMH94539.1 DUF3298 domain-containing protein [Lysobacter pythonis]